MKKLKYFLPALLLLTGLAACNNDLNKTFTSTVLEFDDAVLTTNAVGRSFPVISLANSITAGVTRTARVNLVGPQKASDITVRVIVDPAYSTASPSSYTLVNGGNVVIPGNNGTSSATSSFGSLTVVTSRFTSTTAPIGNLVLILDSTSTDFKPSQNYRRLGYSFRQ